ncbi:hypothetical protein Tco_1488683, partial [Tanacetum coccineum]
MDNLNLFYQDIGPSSSAGRHLTQKKEEKRHWQSGLAKDMLYKVELDGKTVKEDEEAVKRIKDTGSDINTMPYRIFKTLGREDMKKIDKGIIMIDHTQAEAMGKLSNVLCQVGVTIIIAKFLILYIPINRDAPIVVAARFDVLRTAKSDSDDEEEYVIKRNMFGAPIYGPRPAPYLN